MVRKTALALALSIGLLGASGARALAQEVVVRAAPPYVEVPPAYVEIGPPPGPGYVWIPRYHRWEFHHYYRGFVRPAPRAYFRRWR